MYAPSLAPSLYTSLLSLAPQPAGTDCIFRSSPQLPTLSLHTLSILSSLDSRCLCRPPHLLLLGERWPRSSSAHSRWVHRLPSSPVFQVSKAPLTLTFYLPPHPIHASPPHPISALPHYNYFTPTFIPHVYFATSPLLPISTSPPIHTSTSLLPPPPPSTSTLPPSSLLLSAPPIPDSALLPPFFPSPPLSLPLLLSLPSVSPSMYVYFTASALLRSSLILSTPPPTASLPLFYSLPYFLSPH